jgi:aldehyde:ferredoxin oxidoreductase
MYPALNFREGVSDRIAEVEGPTMTRTILSGRESCPGCPVACRRVVGLSEGRYTVDPRYGGPEFETIGALGTCCGVYDLAAIAKGNELCNAYGLDTINTGLSIAWAMECYERGIFTLRDTGGLELGWGNAEAVLELIEQIALRRGLGNLLADGLKNASRKVGRGSEDFAMQVKNMAFPTHEPRGKVSQGVSFATSNRGACHTQGIHDTSLDAGKTAPEIGFDDKYKGLPRMSKQYKGEVAARAQNLRAWQDSLIICRFTSWDYGPTPPSMLAEALEAVTGIRLTPEELMLAGERIFNLCRLFNLREGFSRADDTLPKRMSERLPRGATSESTISQADLDGMLDEYYAFRGWTRDGVPTPEKLRQLGLQA